MSREIKFRAKRKLNGDWVYGYYVKAVSEDWCLMFDEINDPIGESDPCRVITSTVGQYTGLKDKNLKDIYEGDIIEYKSYTAFKRWWNNTSEIPEIEASFNKKRNEFTLLRQVVSYREGCFCLGYGIYGSDIARGYKFETGRHSMCDSESKQFDFEVIGNIHENTNIL